MAAVRLAGLLAGDAASRQAAYTELTALANGDGADATTNMSTATLHVGGIEGELEDETKLTEVFGHFGSVLAVTLRVRREGKKVSWALLTFTEESESAKALQGAAELGVDGLVARRVDTQQMLGSTGAMGSVMRTHHTRVDMSVAVACVHPLVDNVLTADASNVDAAEAQHACWVLSCLMLLGAEACAEFMRDERWFKMWKFPSSALGLVFAKQPADLTRDDVMLAAAIAMTHLPYMCRGMSACLDMVGLDEMSGLMQNLAACSFLPSVNPSDDLNKQLVLMGLEICRNPQGLSELEKAGMWTMVYFSIAQRPAVAVVAHEAGVWELGMGVVNTHSPADWIGWNTMIGCKVTSIVSVLSQFVIMPPPGVNLPTVFYESGFAQAFVRMFQAFELRGADNVHSTNVVCIVQILVMMQQLDLSAPESAPIVKLLRQIPSALQFTLDHPLIHIKSVGAVSSSACAMICAVVFGKEEEDGGFSFSQQLIDEGLDLLRNICTGTLQPFFPLLPPHFLRPLVHLCISDVNKWLLVQSSEFKVTCSLCANALLYYVG